MPVTPDNVAYMANMVRLQLTDEEKVYLVKDMNDILEYMELLGQVNTSSVPPLPYPLHPITHSSVYG